MDEAKWLCIFLIVGAVGLFAVMGVEAYTKGVAKAECYKANPTHGEICK